MSAITESASTAVKYPPHSPLRSVLNERVRAFFEQTGRRPEGGYRIWSKTGVVVAWAVLSYVALVFWASSWWQAILLASSLGFAVAGIGFNIQHDGGHGAYSRRRSGNRLAAWALDLIGGSSYFWHFKHNVVHHHYTNIEGVDDDIRAEPLLRMAPGQKRRWYHRFQHVYVWFFYGLLPPKWQFFDDFRSLVRGKVADRPVPRPRGRDLAVLFGGKLFCFGWALALPLALHSWINVLLVYAWCCVVLGVTLATTFQLAHCVQEAEFSKIPAENERMRRDWVEHQLATTVDFAPRSRWLTWYLGGLNYQVEHHLFPHISHVHYPDIAPLLRAVCRERGVSHRTHETLWSALRSHVGWLRQLGRAPS